MNLADGNRWGTVELAGDVVELTLGVKQLVIGVEDRSSDFRKKNTCTAGQRPFHEFSRNQRLNLGVDGGSAANVASYTRARTDATRGLVSLSVK